MNTYAYEAVDAGGASSAGVLEVASQSEAVRRIKEMGLFPLRVAQRQQAGSNEWWPNPGRAAGAAVFRLRCLPNV